jgi:hypothetical protein
LNQSVFGKEAVVKQEQGNIPYMINRHCKPAEKLHCTAFFSDKIEPVPLLGNCTFLQCENVLRPACIIHNSCQIRYNCRYNNQVNTEFQVANIRLKPLERQFL